MLNERIRNGIRVGGLAGAATAGALVGLGVRHDLAISPFVTAGRSFFWKVGAHLPSPLLALSTGVLVHFMWMILWGICFSALATHLRGFALLIAGTLFVVFIAALASTIVPGALGAAEMTSLNAAQTLFVLTLLGGSLVVGMRVVGRAT